MSYDRDEWRQPWRTGAAARPDVDRTSAADDDADTAVEPAVSGAEPTTRPIARFPQPPPSSWDDRSAGPGSPAGSVRPPDTTGTVDAPPAQRRRRGGLVLAIGAFLGAIAGTLATLVVTGVLLGGETEPTETDDDTLAQIQAPSIELPDGNGSTVPAVAAAVTPSVVTIDVSTDGADPFGMTPALGSGVIYRSDGYILTNHHVIEGGQGIRVRLASGELLDAEVIGSDELNDLAVVRVEETGLPAVNLRPVDEPIVVGEPVVAIGSPFGLDASVTAGIVSALNREIRLDDTDEAGHPLTITSVLQTDAAINPGNSGGALVDAAGRLIGINTAILTRTGVSQGVGFAVSAEQAVSSADQLIDQGFVRHPLLGITGRDVTPEIAEEFELSSSQGAIVEAVQDGTGADEAGMRGGDIIIAVDGDRLSSMTQLVAEVRRRAPGDVLDLTILRDGEELSVEVELGER